MSRIQDLIDKLGLSDKMSSEEVSRAPAMEQAPQYPIPQSTPDPQYSNLKERIKQYENPNREGYNKENDSWIPHASPEGGAPTIGYGDKLSKGKYSPDELQRIQSKGMTNQETEAALQRNINNAQSQAEDLLKQKGISNLSTPQKEAVAEMVFQMGKVGTGKFTNMFDALKGGDYDRAQQEALSSEWAKQTPQRAKEVASRLNYNKLKRYIYRPKTK